MYKRPETDQVLVGTWSGLAYSNGISSWRFLRGRDSVSYTHLQLIYDLRNSNPDARVSVKLVSEVGIGAAVSYTHLSLVMSLRSSSSV